MKYSFVTLILFFKITICFAQNELSINTDAGNLALLRPNIGFEYRVGKAEFTLLGLYQSNKWFVTEMPTLLKSKGLRIDLSYKSYIFKNRPRIYYETLARLQESQTSNVQFFKEYPLKHLENSIELGQKIGIKSRNQKFFYIDFSFGIGGRLKFIQQKDLFVIDPDYQSRLDNRNRQPFINLVPYLQFRLGHRLKR
ncbi:MAG: DUF3575 domain-containing protein [Spirosomaceae bacterium]|jgi:hypothetical protein|nr:DUF3575 domain-containing protein [Spirosomataceae bacterium]